MWMTIANIGWAVSAVFALWMLYDWYKTDTSYSEATLTSSREGEIEAVTKNTRFEEATWHKATTAGSATKSFAFPRLGPAHVWALGVGIVLVGEYTGWNFAADKGGTLAALIICWVIGLLYTSVAMIDSEVTSTVLPRWPICTSQAHCGAAYGLQCGALFGLCLHDA